MPDHSKQSKGNQMYSYSIEFTEFIGRFKVEKLEWDVSAIDIQKTGLHKRTIPDSHYNSTHRQIEKIHELK